MIAVTENVSESFHIVSHDPSLALYRLQEHVRKSLPILVERRIEVEQLHQGLQGACFDVENAIEVTSSMEQATRTFQKIHDSLKTAMYFKQQLDYEKMRRANKTAKGLHHVDSSDSLIAEMRKTKSMGHLKRSGVGGGGMDGVGGGEGSEFGEGSSSVLSRSTTSTPVSEFPSAAPSTAPGSPTRRTHGGPVSGRSSQQSGNGSFTMNLGDDYDDRSSTPTSGADSPSPGHSQDDFDSQPTQSNSGGTSAEQPTSNGRPPKKLMEKK